MPQLDAILNKIRVHLDNKNAGQLFDNLLVGSTNIMEQAAKPFCNIDGFSDMLLHNDAFKNCWERVKCESVMPTVPPHLQMVFIVGQTFYMAYLVNKYKEPSAETKKLIDDVVNEIEQEKPHTQDNVDSSEPKTKDEIIEKPMLHSGMNI